MTLIYDNEVKITCWNLSKMFLIIQSYHLMIKGKIHFMR